MRAVRRISRAQWRVGQHTRECPAIRNQHCRRCSVLVDQIINGLVSGGLYALVALGYTLIFGVLHKLNFAHGEVFMSGGYAGLVALSLGGGIAGALVAAAVVAAMLGLAVELISFR